MKKVKTGEVPELKYGKNGEILGIPVFGGDKASVLKLMEGWLSTNDNKVRFVATVNPEHVMKAVYDPIYRELLRNTSLNVADGIALVWARELEARVNQAVDRRRGRPGVLLRRLYTGFMVGTEILKGRFEGQVVPGSSLMEDLAVIAKDLDLGVMYLGGWGDRAIRTARYFERKHKGIRVVGSPGEPQIERETVLKQIDKLSPEILFVAYGMKKQEEWIKKHLSELEKCGVKLVMGVGRSFDYYSGDLKRAPKKWRKMGLEWLYSLFREPKRWRRQLALPQFVWRTITG